MAQDDAKARRFRVGGSGFSVFEWDGKTIAFARQVAHTSPAPVGPGATPIQPLDERHPVEIVTPVATSMGQMVVEIYELYGEKVWDRLKIIGGSTDLVQIFNKVANTPRQINFVRHVRPPDGSGVKNYSDVYHKCVITNVADGETIEVGTMEITKQITIGYTHYTRSNY